MRNDDKKNQGLTLTELLVVMSVMLVLLAVALPVAKKLAQSLGEATGARSIIAAALANARAIAVREGHYAGVRFQQDSSGRQYLVLIIHDKSGTTYANGFRAIEGKKPMALPEKMEVISCSVQQNYNDNNLNEWNLADNPGQADLWLNSNAGKNDASTFSIVFSPSGKFVNHAVRVYSYNGQTSDDKIFNSESKLDDGSGNPVKIAKFRRDGDNAVNDVDALDGYQQENSVPSFIVYNKSDLEKVSAAQRWSKYFGTLDREFVNPHTGEMVKK